MGTPGHCDGSPPPPSAHKTNSHHHCEPTPVPAAPDTPNRTDPHNARPPAAVRFAVPVAVTIWVYLPKLTRYRRIIVPPYYIMSRWAVAGPVPCRADATPGPRVSTQQPDHHDRYRRVRRAWDTYRLANRDPGGGLRRAVTSELIAARAAGISMYRMAIWLGVTATSRSRNASRSTTETNTPPPPAG